MRNHLSACVCGLFMVQLQLDMSSLPMLPCQNIWLHRNDACQLRHCNVIAQKQNEIHAGHSTLHDVPAFTGKGTN